jgi:hypothetical protein
MFSTLASAKNIGGTRTPGQTPSRSKEHNFHLPFYTVTSDKKVRKVRPIPSIPATSARRAWERKP